MRDYKIKSTTSHFPSLWAFHFGRLTHSQQYICKHFQNCEVSFHALEDSLELEILCNINVI